MIGRADNITPGLTAYCRNLIKFYELNKSTATMFEDVPQEWDRILHEMRKNRKYIAKRQRDHYSTQRDAHNISKYPNEKHGLSSDHYKNQLLDEILVTVHHNTTDFHAFTTAFCAWVN